MTVRPGPPEKSCSPAPAPGPALVAAPVETAAASRDRDRVHGAAALPPDTGRTPT